MFKKINEILITIILVIMLTSIVYLVGSCIVRDYINNGIGSVVFSFIIGIPLLILSSKILAKFICANRLKK